MNPKPYPDSSGRSTGRCARRPLPGPRALCGWTLLLLLLGGGSAAPAHAESGTINGPRTGPITVNAGETLNIVDGAQISGDYHGVDVEGGTLNISGGSISVGGYGLDVSGGSVNISGGSIYAGGLGVYVEGGTTTVSGGSISASGDGLYLLDSSNGTLTISGCGLQLSGGQLIGTLKDGTAINTWTSGLSAGNLDNGAAPQIHCPGDVAVRAATGACGASVNLITPTASDSCRPSLPVVGVRSDGLALTDPYPLGSTLIAWTAADGAGSASCTQTITVDGTAPPPVITVRGSNPLTVECHTTFTDPGATAAGCGSVSMTPSGLVDPNTPGRYTLTYTASDTHGNVVTATRTVNVVDTTAPVITPPANITQAADAGQCSARIAPGTATATDTCAGVLIPTGTRSDGKALSDPYPLGTTTITWTATDPSDNQATATQTVTVKDTQPPTLTVPAAITAGTDPGQCTASLDPGTATAADNCGSATISGARSDGQPLTAPYPLGTSTITWTATDTAGNTAAGTQSITIKDAQGPTISGLSAMPNQLWPPNHKLMDVTVNYTGSDNCGGPLAWTISATSSEADSGLGPDDVPGDIQIVDAHHLKLRAERYATQGRVYTITVTGTDAAGNRTQQSVTVTVPH